MTFLGELRVIAVLDNLRTISYFIHGIARRLQLTEKCLFEIELALEEATVNIIHHAYAADTFELEDTPNRAAEMVLRVTESDDVMHLTIQDWGAPLDPSQVKPFDINAPIEERVHGGMGLHLIHSLMDAVVRRAGGRPGEPNVLTLVKRLEHLEAGAHRPSTLRELHAMRTVSEVMATSIELDELLELIVNKLVETIDAERGTLYLVDEEKGELFSRVLLEDSSTLEEVRVKMGEGISGHVGQTGEVLNIQNAYEDSRFNPDFDHMTGYRTRTILAAPIRNPHGQIIGVVQLLNKKGGPFTTRDARLLTAMAAQAAISIENARLYEQEIQQKLINQELETARRIQRSFLPQTIPQQVNWDIGTFWRPMREVAGDFYDFYPLPDGRLALVIADVSGKGVPAALFMALSVTVLRFAMSLNLAPHELMNRTNQAIIADQQSKMFATVFVAYLNYDSGELEFASAGHNPPLLYRAAANRCAYLEAPGVAVGIFRDANYLGKTVRLEQTDVLVLYTDGITEVFDENEQEFGEERLERLVLQHAGRPAQELADLIVQAATDFASQEGAFDDETLVVIKRQ